MGNVKVRVKGEEKMIREKPDSALPLSLSLSPSHPLSLIFMLALILRLGWVGWLEVHDAGLAGPDAPSYDELATNLLAGRGLQKPDYNGLFTDGTPSLTVRSFRPPLLPIVLAGVYGVFGHHFLAARVLMALLSAATAVIVARIARRVFDAPTGLLAGFLAALYPKLVYYSGLLVTETLCTFLLAAAVWTLLAGDDGPRRTWSFLLSGVLLGLAALARSSLLLLPVGVVAWLFLSRPPRRTGKASAAILLGFLAALAPWWVRNACVHGHFVPATTEGGYTLWVTNNERADGGGHCFWPDPPGGFDGLSEAAIDREFASRGVIWIRANPGGFLRLCGQKFVRFWRLWPHADEPSVGPAAAIVAGATFTPILLLALWGAFAARSRWRSALLFYMIIVYFTALHMVFMAITRYRLPLEPYLIILAAGGVRSVIGRRLLKKETRAGQ
jgi:4-amino-4-deoxy-L-arabinose transferase-like glycosyltransferase